jgi:hypothetical protein
VADQLKMLQRVLAKDGELAELTAVVQERDRTIAALRGALDKPVFTITAELTGN